MDGQVALISILTLLVSSILFAGAVAVSNDSTNQSSALNISLSENQLINISNKTVLAKVFDEDNLDFDREYRLHYLQKNRNFSDVVFTNLTGNTKYTLKAGAVNDKIRGIKINNQNYAIDLLYCEINGKYCAFRINGVPIPQIRSFQEFGNSKVTSFDIDGNDIDGNYILKVNSIKFNHCEGIGFCHFGYQSYDVVDVSIERK